MKRSLLLTVIVVVLCLGIVEISSANLRYFSDFMYLMDESETTWEQIIWFWTPDTIYGHVHSNGPIGLKYSPQFYGHVTTSQNHIIEFSADPWFANPPQFNWPYVFFPDELTEERFQALQNETFFDNPESDQTFRCSASEEGWQIESWTTGTPYDTNYAQYIGEVGYGDNVVLFFDGDVQLAGENVSGRATIGASGNVWLMDNIMYHDVTLENPSPDSSDSYLGIASESNIIVADTYANGRGNGLYDGPYDNHNRKHIVITAALLALGEHFKIEHQNDTWDDYYWCDPNGDHPFGPDERGDIFLYGSLAQKRQGYVHRSNCGGTGYGRLFHYDERLHDNPPFGFDRIAWGGDDGSDIIVSTEQTWSDTSIYLHEGSSIRVIGSSLTLGPGVEIYPNGTCGFLISIFMSDFYIDAERDNPVIISNATNPNNEFQWIVSYSHCVVSDSVWTGLQVDGDYYGLRVPYRLDECSFTGELVELWPANFGPDDTNRVHITNSTFQGGNIACMGSPSRWGSITSSVVEGRLTNKAPLIDRITFIPGNRTPLVGQNNFQVRNSFFYNTPLMLIWGPAEVDYCGYFNCTANDLFGPEVVLGDHILVEVDPLFVDPENGDYHLLPDSPLIDAGDPDSPPDPDGTIADIGAFYFNQTDVPEDPDDLESYALPTRFSVSNPYPNPFNPSTSVTVSLPEAANLRVNVININGRLVAELANTHAPVGYHSFTFDGSGLASGIYFMQAAVPGKYNEIRKVVLMK